MGGDGPQPELSVIIPAYNEQDALAPTVREIAAFLRASGLSAEIVIANDGSTDGTAEEARRLAGELPNVRVLTLPHRGKGCAIRHGMRAAQGRWRLFLDADHSTHIREWVKLAPRVREGYDVVIGSRKMAGSVVHVRQPWLRETMAKVFTWLTNRLLGLRVSDVTCGFKVFSAEAAGRIFRVQRINGWSFDAEVLFLARRFGYRLAEVPVEWRDDASTQVRLMADSLRSLGELMQIRWWAACGRYRAKEST